MKKLETYPKAIKRLKIQEFRSFTKQFTKLEKEIYNLSKFAGEILFKLEMRMVNHV